MPSSGMLRRVALVRADVSEELNASFITVTRICELGTTLAITSNRHAGKKRMLKDRCKFSIFRYCQPTEGLAPELLLYALSLVSVANGSVNTRIFDVTELLTVTAREDPWHGSLLQSSCFQRSLGKCSQV
jgi:hypothetical protein